MTQDVTQFDLILHALDQAGVDFIVVGGVAGIAHGSTMLTVDLDVLYGRNPSNIERLVAALAPYNPYLRGVPPGLPFRWEAPTIASGLNFTLNTTLGNIDLLGEVAGGGTFEDLLPHTETLEAFGVRFRCVSLLQLIRLKRAAGRPKDYNQIAELEALLEEKRRLES